MTATVQFDNKRISAGFVFRLREVLPDAVGIEDPRDARVQVLETQIGGPFEWSLVCSDSGKVYEITRIGFFYHCTCPATVVCRHIRRIYPRVCVKCAEQPVRKLGQTCAHCTEVEAPYLKPALNWKTTKVGGIRI